MVSPLSRRNFVNPIKLARMTKSDTVVKTWGEFTPDDVFEMAVLRTEIFFLEQKIDEEELDALDRHEDTLHLWRSDDRGMTGYLRIVHDDLAADAHEGISWSLGRMVVRKDCRGQGLAKELLLEALEIMGDKPLYLHAQEYVMPLYASVGFTPVGETFTEAGIAHRLMVRRSDA
jgi:ElaA protein|tara:strand:- start:6141 stop:6662 length:522 start_codon:yes stop_codon:yes gene_type:complete